MQKTDAYQISGMGEGIGIGRYVRILTNIDHILTKNTNKYKNMSFFKRACQKKTPAALNNVANMGWGYQY